MIPTFSPDIRKSPGSFRSYQNQKLLLNHIRKCSQVLSHFLSPTIKIHELWLNVKEEFQGIFWWSCVPGGSSRSHANNHTRVDPRALHHPVWLSAQLGQTKREKANNSQGTCYLWISSVGSRKHLRVPCTGSPLLSTVSLQGRLRVWEGGPQSEHLPNHERPWVPSPNNCRMEPTHSLQKWAYSSTQITAEPTLRVWMVGGPDVKIRQ